MKQRVSINDVHFGKPAAREVTRPESARASIFGRRVVINHPEYGHVYDQRVLDDPLTEEQRREGYIVTPEELKTIKLRITSEHNYWNWKLNGVGMPVVWYPLYLLWLE